MNAIQIADYFDSFAIDHKPEGWPAVQQKQLTEAASMLRRQHEAIVRLREALEDIRCSSSCGHRQKEIAGQALKDTESFTNKGN